MTGCEFWTFNGGKLCLMKKASGWTMLPSPGVVSGDKSGNIIWENYDLNMGDIEC